MTGNGDKIENLESRLGILEKSVEEQSEELADLITRLSSTNEGMNDNEKLQARVNRVAIWVGVFVILSSLLTAANFYYDWWGSKEKLTIFPAETSYSTSDKNVKDVFAFFDNEIYYSFRLMNIGDKRISINTISPSGLFEEDYSGLEIGPGGNEVIHLKCIPIDPSGRVVFKAHHKTITVTTGRGEYELALPYQPTKIRNLYTGLELPPGSEWTSLEIEQLEVMKSVFGVLNLVNLTEPCI